MPLEFWVGVAEGQYLQLDDVVVVETPLPDGRTVRLFGVVDLVRARHEGAKFDSDVFLIEDGVMPAAVSYAAHVRVTRVEPEIFVPPRPGQEVRRAAGLDRDQALFFDTMERRLPIGLCRDGEPVFANLDFLDGSRGRPHQHLRHLGSGHQDHLRHLPPQQPLHERGPGGRAANTHGIIFNVKGEDLLFLDQPNEPCAPKTRASTRGWAWPRALRARPAPGPGAPRLARAPARHGQPPAGRRGLLLDAARVRGERLLRFLFAEADDATSQLAFVIDRVEAKLSQQAAACGAQPTIPGSTSRAGGSRASRLWSRP